MIVESKENIKYVSIDIGRPSFTEDDHRNKWKKFFDVVETCPFPVVVNSAYHWIRDMIDAGSGYLGGGFKFCFFFENKEDRRMFAKLCDEIDFKLTDFCNLTFYRNNDKELFVKFAPSYETYTREYLEQTSASITLSQDCPDKLLDILGNPMKIPPWWFYAKGPVENLYQLKTHLDECFFDMDDES